MCVLFLNKIKRTQLELGARENVFLCACITYGVKGGWWSPLKETKWFSAGHKSFRFYLYCRMLADADLLDHLLLFVVFFSGSFFLLSFSNEWTNSTDGPKRAYTPLYGCWRAAASLIMSFCFSFLLSIREPARAAAAAGPWCRAKTGIVYKHSPLVLCRKSGAAVAIKK